MMVSFCAVFFPRGVLDEILNLIESVSEGFPSYSCREYNKNKKAVKFQGDMLNFCEFIQVYVFTTNHHLKYLQFWTL